MEKRRKARRISAKSEPGGTPRISHALFPSNNQSFILRSVHGAGGSAAITGPAMKVKGKGGAPTERPRAIMHQWQNGLRNRDVTSNEQSGLQHAWMEHPNQYSQPCSLKRVSGLHVQEYCGTFAGAEVRA